MLNTTSVYIVLNKLIVFVTVAIPVAPLIVGEGRNEIARWYIAAAANAKELDSGDPEEHLASAASWGGDSVDNDVWFLRLVWALDDQPDEFPELLRQSKEQLLAIGKFADMFAARLCEGGHFTAAVETSEQAIVSGNTSDMNYLQHLNTLAYFRSLAVKDLDKALVDVEIALANLPSGSDEARGMFLDTRAWVLFNLGRHEEALVDMNKCLNLYETSSSPILDLLVANSKSDSSDADGANDGQPSPEDEQLGTLRYHRAKILEALGKTDEAEEDFQWLRDRNLPTDGSLY
ncbi:MAG: hypothetical protein Aurels2KO_47410 [Aureliella sp.]